MHIIWHSRAEQDLSENISYIAQQSPQNAIAVLNTLLELADSLATMAYKYPKEPVYNKEDIRYVTKWHFKIVYRIDTESIYILRVFSTYQHPDKVKL